MKSNKTSTNLRSCKSSRKPNTPNEREKSPENDQATREQYMRNCTFRTETSITRMRNENFEKKNSNRQRSQTNKNALSSTTDHHRWTVAVIMDHWSKSPNTQTQKRTVPLPQRILDAKKNCLSKVIELSWHQNFPKVQTTTQENIY
jgi:hypothetical protein